MPKRNEASDVFKYIDIPSDGNTEPCWPWTGGLGGKDQRGYFSYKGVKWLAYRFVYTLIHGDIPKGIVIRHKCDNKLCCNPHHLEPGTQSDNENDKYDRDRYGFPNHVLEMIVSLSKIPGMTQGRIAETVTNAHGILVEKRRVSEILKGDRRKKQTENMK